MYPIVRLRRTRKYDWLRNIVAETELHPQHMIYPMFVVDGDNVQESVSTLPDVYRFSKDNIVKQAKLAESVGIKAIALFPVVPSELKNEDASEAFNNDNLICQTIKSIKDSGINIGIICDVALDPYTSHGHDGIVIDGDVHNDATIDALIEQAVVLSSAGADIVAPSDMMDGRVGAIRESLDEEGMEHVAILSYAAKYASHFYGPFRDAVGSRSSFGKNNKTTYQMDPRNLLEAMREIELDIEEGADMVMVKPGMPYLDVIREASNSFAVPIFGYQVSGEYAMMKYAANAGCFDFMSVMRESLMSFRRAGATGIFTYAALEVAKELNK